MIDCSTGGPSVVLVVRQGNRYGSAEPGDEVRVDVAELHNAGSMSALMRPDDVDTGIPSARNDRGDVVTAAAEIED